MSQNCERFPENQTDKMWSRWHRSLPNRATSINLDSCEYCERCKRPLALIETTTSTTWKPTSVMNNLAQMAQIPAYVIIFQPDSKAFQEDNRPEIVHKVWIRQTAPTQTKLKELTPTECATWIVNLHDTHTCAPADTKPVGH